MTRLPVLCFLSVMLMGCAATPAKNDPWFSKDKFYHFGASALAAGVTTAAADANGLSDSETWQTALGVTLTLGIGKETYDTQVKNKFWSWKDLFWDLMGGLAGYGIVKASK